jgi:hypothetical protein
MNRICLIYLEILVSLVNWYGSIGMDVIPFASFRMHLSRVLNQKHNTVSCSAGFAKIDDAFVVY